MRRVAIFDLDGTLVDSRYDIAAAGNYARTTLGLPALALDKVIQCVGDGLDKLIERIIPDESQRDAAKSAFSTYYLLHCCDQTAPYDGIIETLERLRYLGWDLTVATNKPDQFTKLILAGCHLQSFFTEVRGGDAAKKPDPGQLLDIFSARGGDAATSWMIGDHHTDIRAGRAAGCHVAFCTWGIGHDDKLPVDVRIAHPRELITLLSA